MNAFNGPGPGEPISRSDLRDVADGVSNLYDSYGLVGINVDRTQSTPVMSVPQRQKVNARVLSGTNPYAWEGVVPADISGTNWTQDGINWGTIGIAPLFDRNGKSGLEAGDVVEAWLMENIGAWVCDSGVPPGLLPATLTRRMLVGSDWMYAYSWDSYHEGTTADPGFNVAGTDADGTLPYEIVSVHTQTQDGLNKDIWTITVQGATGGEQTFTESILGGSTITTTSAVAYNASDSTINGVLTKFTVASTTTGDTITHVFTGPSPSSNGNCSITINSYASDPLVPEHPHYPALFRNDIPMDVPVAQHLTEAGGADAAVSYSETQKGDGASVSQIIVIAVEHTRDGTFGLQMLSTDSPQNVAWDAAATVVHSAFTALGASIASVTGSVGGPWTVTFSDFVEHSPILDDTNLIGTTWYIVVKSNDAACMAPLGGVWYQGIDGWAGPDAPDAVLSPSTGVGPYTLTITNTTSGNYQLAMDGGSPSDQVWTSGPTLTGITVTTLGAGVYILTGDGTTSHTFQLYFAELRNTEPDWAPYIHNSCAHIEPIGEC